MPFPLRIALRPCASAHIERRASVGNLRLHLLCDTVPTPSSEPWEFDRGGHDDAVAATDSVVAATRAQRSDEAPSNESLGRFNSMTTIRRIHSRLAARQHGPRASEQGTSSPEWTGRPLMVADDGRWLTTASILWRHRARLGIL